MNTVVECLNNDKEMESLNDSPSFKLTSETLYGTDTQSFTKATVTSFLLAFPASPLVQPDFARESVMPATYGPKPLKLFARFDPDTLSWKMCEVSSRRATSKPSSKTWPKAGMMHDGACYRQPKWERLIDASGSGLLVPTPVVPNGGRHHNLDNITLKGNTLYRKTDGTKAQMDLETYVRLWPTPTARPPGWVVGGSVEVVDKDGNPPLHPNQRFYDKNTGRIVQKGLEQVATMWPTPQSRDYRTEYHTEGVLKRKTLDLNKLIGGKLNPTWTEWLMAWPLEWTALKPLAMDKFQFVPQSHFYYWLEMNLDAIETWKTHLGLV